MSEKTRTRRVRLETGPDGLPVLDHLTATEAKAGLRQALVDLQRAEGLRRALSSALVALVHQANTRGVLGPDGQPVVPMQATISKASADVGLQQWRFAMTPQIDGSISVIVDRGEDLTPKVVT